MITAIRIPSLDSSSAKAMLLRILVKSGDKVVSGAAIAEIETEKATFPVESPWSGTVAELLAAGGQELAIGSPLITIETSDAGAAEFTDLPPLTPPFQGGENQGLYSCSETSRVLFNEKFSGALPAFPPEHQLQAEASAQSFAARNVSISETRQLQGGSLRTQQRMLWSARNIPSSSVTLPIEIGALKSKVDEFRAASRKLLNVTDIIIWAAARALRAYPEFNAYRSGNELRFYKDVNVGIVYDIQGELVVPAVTNADTRTILELAGELRSLYRAVTARSLPPAKVGVATFTVSNMFGSGATHANPLINAGQSAVLLIGAPFNAPLADDDTLRFAAQLNLVLGFDHSVVNGARAAAFLKRISRECADANV